MVERNVEKLSNQPDIATGVRLALNDCHFAFTEKTANYTVFALSSKLRTVKRLLGSDWCEIFPEEAYYLLQSKTNPQKASKGEDIDVFKSERETIKQMQGAAPKKHSFDQIFKTAIVYLAQDNKPYSITRPDPSKNFLKHAPGKAKMSIPNAQKMQFRK